MLSLVRSKEKFELFVQALAIAGLKDPEQPLLQGHRPSLRANQEVLQRHDEQCDSQSPVRFGAPMASVEGAGFDERTQA